MPPLPAEYFSSYVKDRVEAYEKSLALKPQIVESVKKKDPLESMVTPLKVWTRIEEILKMNRFSQLNLVGTPGSGKTQTAKEFIQLAIASGFEKAIYAQPEDLLKNSENIGESIDLWIEKATLRKYKKVVIFLDDWSYLSQMLPKIQAGHLKNIVTRLRKIFTEDGQVFLIIACHHINAIPPIMRDVSTWIFTTLNVGSKTEVKKSLGFGTNKSLNFDGYFAFIERLSILGQTKKQVKFQLPDSNEVINFRWGSNEEKGDGRIFLLIFANYPHLIHVKFTANFDIDVLKIDAPKNVIHNQSTNIPPLQM